MNLPSVDWLSLWKLYNYPLFFWVYVGMGVPLRLVMARHSDAVSITRFWLLSSTASAVSVALMPFATIPAFVVTAASAGEHAVHSLLMAAPIAASIGIFGAAIDALLIRVLLRQRLSRKKSFIFLATNTANISLAVGTVVSLAIAYPPEILAIVRFWR